MDSQSKLPAHNFATLSVVMNDDGIRKVVTPLVDQHNILSDKASQNLKPSKAANYAIKNKAVNVYNTIQTS